MTTIKDYKLWQIECQKEGKDAGTWPQFLKREQQKKEFKEALIKNKEKEVADKAPPKPKRKPRKKKVEA